MVADTSIYNQIQQPKLDNPLNALAQVAQLQHFQSQNMLSGLKADEYQRGVAEENALRQAYASNADPKARLEALAKVSPKGYQSEAKFQIDQQKSQRDSDKSRLELVKQNVDMQGQLLGGVKDEASWQQALQAAQNAGMDTSKFPQQYDPNFVTSARVRALTAAQQVEQEWKQKGYDLDVRKTDETNRHNKATEGLTLSGQKQTERHFQANQSAPQYMETDAGLVALPKKLALGQVPTGTPVMGANGEALGKPLKPIPPSVNTAIINNNQSLNQIDRALTLLSGNNVGDPKQGGMQGDTNATGFKGYLPNGILNRVDPQGVATRAEISDIGSLKIHDRSGAAVTVSESPRLMPFVPLSTDDAATVAKKLTRLKLELQNESSALAETYSKEQGYRPSPVSRAPTSRAPAAKAGGVVDFGDLK